MEGIRSKEGCIVHCSKNLSTLEKLQEETSCSTLIDAEVIQEAIFFQIGIIFIEQAYHTLFESFSSTFRICMIAS